MAPTVSVLVYNFITTQNEQSLMPNPYLDFTNQLNRRSGLVSTSDYYLRQMDNGVSPWILDLVRNQRRTENVQIRPIIMGDDWIIRDPDYANNLFVKSQLSEEKQYLEARLEGMPPLENYDSSENESSDQDSKEAEKERLLVYKMDEYFQNLDVNVREESSQTFKLFIRKGLLDVWNWTSERLLKLNSLMTVIGEVFFADIAAEDFQIFDQCGTLENQIEQTTVQTSRRFKQ